MKNLCLHVGKENLNVEAHKIISLIQKGFQAIEQKKNELKERKRVFLFDEYKNRTRQALKGKVKETLMPYFFSLSDENATFPYNVNNELVQTWLDYRIPNESKLRGASMEGIQKLFGLTDYIDLSNLSQQHLIMVLKMLKKYHFNEKETYQRHMEEMVRSGIVSVETFNGRLIYNSDRCAYSEDTHRALCSIYLGILPINASGFRLERRMPEDKAPWKEPGPQYESSKCIRLRKEHTEM